MFERLQKKWNVNGIRLALILCTFAIGGSLTGIIGKKIMNLLDWEKNVLWFIVYIILITLIWPLMVLVVSVFFGQFNFFVAYLKKMGSRMGLVKKETILKERKIPSLVIFASGAGSNAQKIIDYFKNHQEQGRVSMIVCNNPSAGVIQIAEKENIRLLMIERNRFLKEDGYLPEIKQVFPDLIILAGFLWKIPATLISAFPQRIINIHPALLPDFGGKGMYGDRVHEAVIAAGKTETGITIHYVDEQYDHGDTILQVTCPVYPNDTPETLASRIHKLEHEHFTPTILKLISY